MLRGAPRRPLQRDCGRGVRAGHLRLSKDLIEESRRAMSAGRRPGSNPGASALQIGADC